MTEVFTGGRGRCVTGFLAVLACLALLAPAQAQAQAQAQVQAQAQAQAQANVQAQAQERPRAAEAERAAAPARIAVPAAPPGQARTANVVADARTEYLTLIETLRHSLAGTGAHATAILGRAGYSLLDVTDLVSSSDSIQLLFQNSDAYLFGFVKDQKLYWLGPQSDLNTALLPETVRSLTRVFVEGFKVNYQSLSNINLDFGALVSSVEALTGFTGERSTDALKTAIDRLAVMFAEAARFSNVATVVGEALVGTGRKVGFQANFINGWRPISRQWALGEDHYFQQTKRLTFAAIGSVLVLAHAIARNPRDITLPAFTGPLQSAKDGLVADVHNADSRVGTRVKALAGTGHAAQTWSMRWSDTGGWRFISKLDPNRALGQSADSHQAVLVEAAEGRENQQWRIIDAGDGWAVVRNGDRCLTAGSSDATLLLKGCDPAQPGQRWKAPGVAPERAVPPLARTGLLTGIGGQCLEVRDGRDADGTPVRQNGCSGAAGQVWTLASSGEVRALGKCLDVQSGGASAGSPVRLWSCNGSPAQKWVHTGAGELLNPQSDNCLDVPGGVVGDGRQLQVARCDDSAAQRWSLAPVPKTPPGAGDAGDPFDDSPDNRGAKPAASGDCRPEGMKPTEGVATRYCDVYDSSGREWVGNDRSRRVIGYFNGRRTGANGTPRYLVSNIPWTKVTHINYAFARVENDRISVGDVQDPANPATGMTWSGARNAMDPSLPYKGHFNLLNTYKKRHPAVKTLISVGGWEDTRNLYAMATNADGTVNERGIAEFADSVTAFLDRYGFDGVDIDYEYPTSLPNTGNPADWDVSNPRRAGLQQGYNVLMKTLREKLDRAGTAKGRYYLLTSAGSSSGYLVRGLDAGQALQYQDYVNIMAYDLHGSWNKYVGPQAPLYDDGRDNELADAGVYDDQSADTKDFQKHGYFNADWAYHYYRGALSPSRINMGIPYYSRGWRDVQGGTDGLWGTATMPDQSQCPKGTGGRGPSNAQRCGLGAIGIDNIWHDKENGQEVGAGSNPLWHTKNLQAGLSPGYLRSYGVDPGSQTGRLTGAYTEKYSDALQAPWLWNDSKKVFLSTENERSLDAKARYIADKGIGGAMMWELSGDYTRRSGGEWGMGYDLTSRLDTALRAAGAPDGTQAGAGRSMPKEAVDVRVELTDFPTGEKDLFPMQPKLRITNNTKVTLAQGTEIALDLPTSTPPNVKDRDYKELKGLVPGHTGPNAGGLKGAFHRLTLTLGYCEDLAPGASREIDLRYYLPITGPANVTVKAGGKEFASTTGQRRGTTVVDPPAPASGTACRAAAWKPGQVYRPDGGRMWRMYDKGAQGWQFEYADSPAGRPMMIDNFPDQSRVHLVEADAGNPNQYWKITSVGGGLHTVASGGRCLTATGSREDTASIRCDERGAQKWKLVPISDSGQEGAPGGPRHNGLFKLRAAGADHDIEAANGATDRETRIITGDLANSTAAFVKHGGYYWYAQWYTTVEPGTAEANGGKPWQRLSPAAP
ncbi:glycosyl hydrolase family 18 protein [Streptomyces jumonjinensis]|uniref:GH18 domain-containing protein n=1 Tax=Streptomyces jumonjinensis TaxID=1945 RepID=A0A646KJ77_STRJU|nr:glycosyl hydrolase family 18 protein [Streptomyces jumonjinensis]MQT02121.1 hypothetical protein [Streptomyces jumonjinensis]